MRVKLGPIPESGFYLDGEEVEHVFLVQDGRTGFLVPSADPEDGWVHGFGWTPNVASEEVFLSCLPRTVFVPYQA